MDSAKTLTGWILPNGSWLECAWGCHLDVAEAVGEHHPDENGWIHVNFRNVGFCGLQSVEPVSHMTQKQMDTLVRVCLAANQPLPFWAEDVTVDHV